MSFSLTNALSTFQGLMNDFYLGCSFLTHIEWVIQCLQAHQLMAKKAKCLFGQESMGHLGHIISAQGVAVDLEKNHEVRSSLGLTGYYHNFLRHYATVFGPLSDLLKKDNFHRNSQAVTAFTQLQKLLTFTPVLQLSNFTKPFVLNTNASRVGIDVVLSQNHHLIAYFSQNLNSQMEVVSTYQ
ncbi:Retrovirus-related Pol polyprotein from transposon 297 family [Gossypium australe]|uniref:Retrovirus-related Pol polyprotein from transposon 297 family n=1 Tax=Gossypium australe TaxID=47621 RepID=A0A5B6X053_9ROSI|nr:Retrovirus-related Pol polyprotein from transposon 297 family [Gossypium australe]